MQWLGNLHKVKWFIPSVTSRLSCSNCLAIHDTWRNGVHLTNLHGSHIGIYNFTVIWDFVIQYPRQLESYLTRQVMGYRCPNNMQALRNQNTTFITHSFYLLLASVTTLKCDTMYKIYKQLYTHFYTEDHFLKFRFWLLKIRFMNSWQPKCCLKMIIRTHDTLMLVSTCIILTLILIND